MFRLQLQHVAGSRALYAYTSNTVSMKASILGAVDPSTSNDDTIGDAELPCLSSDELKQNKNAPIFDNPARASCAGYFLRVGISENRIPQVLKAWVECSHRTQQYCDVG